MALANVELPRERLAPAVYAAAVFLSAGLLMSVQPLCAKMLLPQLGGTPAVWNTCMVFFQTGLLAGYAYAHWAPGWLGLRLHGLLHAGLLAAATLTLPIALAGADAALPPVVEVLATLVQGVGLPYVLLASTAPLLQRWFAARPAAPGRDPYLLYAASNLGSFLALFAYPLVVEPTLTLREQAHGWRWGFCLLAALIATCIPWRLRAPVAPAAPAAPAPADAPPTWGQRGRWVLLSLVPSSLLLSVTTFITTDVAPIPLLWALPLGLYLLSFVLVFGAPHRLPQVQLARWFPLVILVMALLAIVDTPDALAVVIFLNLLGFFWIALACHLELAESRPQAGRLTEFFLWLAVGGACGGGFTALLAPLLFPALVEYPLLLVAAWLLVRVHRGQPFHPGDLAMPGLILAIALGGVLLGRAMAAGGDPGDARLTIALGFLVPLLLCFVCQANAWQFGLGLAAIFAASVFYPGVHGQTVHRERSYFGVHRVTRLGDVHRLVHGNTLHGQQSLDSDLRATPMTYYFPTGPIGSVLRALERDPRCGRVGVVGLGTGALAAYAQKGQHWTFFEIDPSVQRIAESPRLFTYLHDARARGADVEVELGDARLSLAKSDSRFGLLVIDAFGSDAIPVHLLTREALDLYFAHLQPEGILAFHISNRYVDLTPVLANLARQGQRACLVQRDLARPSPEEARAGKSGSIWVLLARERGALEQATRGGAWHDAPANPHARVWSDDFSNLLEAFHWQGLSE